MKKILLIILIMAIFQMVVLSLTYTSQYPPAHNNTYVKATTIENVNYDAHYATDPETSLIGGHAYTSWASFTGQYTNQRFHIDLGSAKIIRRIYYENLHSTGAAWSTPLGVKNFTFWGSNTGEGTFDDLVYANDEGWTQIAPENLSQTYFDEHSEADEADPKYITVTNTTEYRYYAFKFADNYSGADWMGVRQIELQTEDGYGAGITWNGATISEWNGATISEWNGI